MLYTKACPRCTGDIKLDRDNFGVYAKCLQCGFSRDFQTRREASPFETAADTPITPDMIPGMGEMGDEPGEQRGAA